MNHQHMITHAKSAVLFNSLKLGVLRQSWSYFGDSLLPSFFIFDSHLCLICFQMTVRIIKTLCVRANGLVVNDLIRTWTLQYVSMNKNSECRQIPFVSAGDENDVYRMRKGMSWLFRFTVIRHRTKYRDI